MQCIHVKWGGPGIMKCKNCRNPSKVAEVVANSLTSTFFMDHSGRSSPHHVTQHRPTGSETPPYAPQRSRFGSEPPSVEDDVDMALHNRKSCMPEMTTTTVAAQGMSWPMWTKSITGFYHMKTDASTCTQQMWAEPGGIVPWPGWLTIILQCYDYDTVGWVMWPVKSSSKWPIMCRVGH